MAKEKSVQELLKTIPTKDLLRAARERNRELNRTFGPFAAQKKLSPCPYCKQLKGVREMREHKKDCKGQRRKTAA
jgi:hypothetical protein